MTQNSIVIYEIENGQTHIEVTFERDKSVVSRHLKNILDSGKLIKDSVVAKNTTTAADGNKRNTAEPQDG